MRRLVVAAVVVATVLGGCTGSKRAGAPAGQASEAFPVTVTAQNGAVTIPASPKRIVSMSATATQMLYAICPPGGLAPGGRRHARQTKRPRITIRYARGFA